MSFRERILQLRLIINQLLRHSVTLQLQVVLLLVLLFLGVVIGPLILDKIADIAGIIVT